MIRIYPYKMGSGSAKALAEALAAKRLNKEGKAIHVAGTIINWGSSALYRDMTYEGEFLNSPEAVEKAANKLQAFKTLQGHSPIPEWTESVPEAAKWLDEGSTVVCRTILNGNSGAGIVLAETRDELVPAPLYTKFVKKKNEYRVHVFQGRAIMLQRKARKLDVPDDQVNWKIRNHANGFIFAHKDVVVPPNGIDAAINAVGALGLDFGAVDLMEDGLGQCFVLEVNTAPGLEGTTLERYVEAFKEIA